MRKSKKILSLYLALVMALGLLPTAAFAATDDYTVTEVIPCKYDEVGTFSEGLAQVRLNYKWGFVDKTGNEVVPCKYSEVKPFSEGLARVRLNGKWGFVDETGKEVVPCKYDYDDTESFSEGLARVKLNGKVGYIDKTGKEVVPCKYDNGWTFSNGLAAVKLNDKWGFIDKTGKEVVPCKYRWAGIFSEGLVAVNLDGKYGYMGTTGKEVVPCKYDNGWSFSEGLAAVEMNDKVGYIDKTGKEVVPCKYDQMPLSLSDEGTVTTYSFFEGLAVVTEGTWPNGKYGYIDKTGKEVVPCKYDVAWPFSEGLAQVSLNYKWGFIDKTGNEVVPCKYSGTEPFSEGLAVVLDGPRPNGKYGYIDKTGNEVVPCKYNDAKSFSEGFARVQLDGKYGYIDKTGKEVVPCKYDDAESFSEGLARVKLNGKWGFIAIRPVEPTTDTAQPTPELPLADVAVPVTMVETFEAGDSWEWVTYDAVRITHVVSQETVMYEGEPMELYSIYPGARVWKTKTDTYSPMKIFKATLKNGILTGGELDFAFEIEEPLYHLGYLYWDEDEVGNYYIAEIGDTSFDKKIGIHIVEGKLPENAPIYYVYDVAMTREATYNDDTDIYTVPVGTVVTVPYDTARGHTSYGFVGPAGVWAETNPSNVELYMCNGRKSFTVEPGRLYHVNYDKHASFDTDALNEAHIYIMAENSTASPTASPSTQTVNVDGKAVTFAMYALNDGATNYIRVRDLAAVLNGTSAQFNVGWNGNVTLTSKTRYDGATDKAPFATPMAYTDYTNPTYVDGKAVDLEAIQIEYNGGGFTYYKLRDLAQALNFNVGWSADKGIFVETNKPYDPNN